MKKAVCVLLALVFVLALAGCGGKAGGETAGGTLAEAVQPDFSLNACRGELSWVAWAIETQYGNSTLKRAKLVELFDPEEEFVIALLPGEKAGETERVLVFSYNCGIRDAFSYNHSVYEVTWTSSPSPDGGRTLEVSIAGYEQVKFYVNLSAAGAVKSAAYQWGRSPDEYCYGVYDAYAYDALGRVSSISRFETYGLLDENVKTGRTEPEYEWKQEFFYTKQGELERIDETALREAKTETWLRYTYENGNRLSVTELSEGVPVERGQARFERNERGYVRSAAFGDEYAVRCTYNPDGTVSFDWYAE